jgi:hypothetical protein
MPVIFRFFWFFCAAFMAINVVIWRRRLATLVSRGAAAQAESTGFSAGPQPGLSAVRLSSASSVSQLVGRHRSALVSSPSIRFPVSSPQLSS